MKSVIHGVTGIVPGMLFAMAMLLCGNLAVPSAAFAGDVPRWHGIQGEGPGYLRDFDARSGRREVSAAQRQAAKELGASVRWNRYGTPQVMINYHGYLSQSVAGTPELIARQFLKRHAALTGVGFASIDAMETLRISPLHESPDYARMLKGKAVPTTEIPHVVLLRQRIGEVPAAGPDGLVTVGIASDGRVVFVGSTLTPDTELRGSQLLDETQALRLAADNAEMPLGEIQLVSSARDDYASYSSSVLPDVQRVRRRALPTPAQGVRLVYEVILLDSSHDRGNPQAFVTLVDAQTGQLWSRNNAVDHYVAPRAYRKAATFGAYDAVAPPGSCAEPVPFTVEGTDNGLITLSGIVTATSDGGDDDIVLRLQYQGRQVAEFDSLTQPEPLVYQPADGIPPGEYGIVVCPFTSDQGELSVSGTYSATPGAPVGATPAWRVFPLAPVPFFDGVDGADPGDDIRQLWCWTVTDADDDSYGRSPEACQGPELNNIGSRVPWDALADGTPTFTTHGNNASTANSNISFVSPDTVFMRPVASDRSYDFPFTDAWAKSHCDPTAALDPSRNFNDVFASTTNLFAMHNRMHDWSYLLGFTEVNSNLQFDNFGNTSIGNSATSPQRENDGELGSAQAGRYSPVLTYDALPLPTINRNNANQLTLFDGIPGITNQYLWQAWPAISYPPCVDGSFDMAIVAHEYTHAISNRMTAGPDGSLGGDQDGRMGEAWSDLAAVEYQLAYGLAPLGIENPFALAVYAIGNPQTGLRNYAIDRSPLSYADMGYDRGSLASPHADSEIWGATQYRVRQALVDKYAAQFPADDRQLQIDCADGRISSQACPGNRRWIQLIFDGFLLQPGSPSMLDARDAILAADRLRYHGANQRELWEAFARSGMGQLAFSDGSTDLQPRPDFSSALREDNARIHFGVQGSDGSVPVARIHVGHFEARTRPVATTLAESGMAAADRGFVPGSYDFTVQADGYGIHRFTLSFEAGQVSEVVFPLRPNLASMALGAMADGDADTPEDLLALIDDTEATNWQSTISEGTASEGKGEGAFVEGREVTVRLAQPSLVTQIQVSAALPPDRGGRFTALRSFDIFACDAALGDCSAQAGFRQIYRSADDAFPGRYFRPKTPDLNLRAFDVEDTFASHVRIVVRDNQCTGGPLYQREANPSGDPFNDPDCDTGSNPMLEAGDLVGAPPTEVRIAELQVFSQGQSQPLLSASTAPSRQTAAPVVASRGGVADPLALLLLSVLASWLGVRRRHLGRSRW